MLTFSAPAKINLILEVLGRRGDGFHEIRSLLQTISLGDTLSFELAEGIHLRCSDLRLESPDNLAFQAASLLREVTGCRQGARIEIDKVIPVTSGLGGGSSDAATTLKGLNGLWETGLSLPELLQLASRLSSDASFFLYGGTALAEGKGERVSPLAPWPKNWLVLLIPPLPEPPRKTAGLYASLHFAHFTQGELADRTREMLSRGEGVDPSLLFNVFEKVAFDYFPGLDGYWRGFLEAGAESVHLAGSGPALFTLVKEEAEAKRLYRRLQQQGLESYLSSTLEAMPDE
jgi:4-diphosphocytidyl-2-C-methyl-D-erythritol kinase